jgi:hemolysin activation/secretion protein
MERDMSQKVSLLVNLLLLFPLFLTQIPVQANSLVEETSPVNPTNQLMIKEIQITGNTVLHREIEEISEKFSGKTGNIAEIQTDILNLLFLLDLLYQEQGYIGTKAIFLPGQNLSEGVFRIVVVEGKLESIEIEGLKRLDPNYVRERLWLEGAVPLNLEKLHQSLQLLQANPLFSSVEANLAPGLEPNGRRLIVKVEESPPMTLRVDYNNYQSETVGANQISASAFHQNLSGNGDLLSLQGNFTEGLNQYYLDYQIPINPHDGYLKWHGEWGDSRIVQPPLDQFDLTGNTTKVSLTWAQPVWRTPQTQLSLFLSFSWQETESFLLGEPFSLIEETPNGVSTISSINFGQELILRSSESVLVLRNQFLLGVDWFNATTTDKPSGRDSQFLAWQFQSQYSQILNPSLLFNTRLIAQITADVMLPGEIFQIGGAYTVRGYDYNIRSGDGGVAGSVELIWTPVTFANEGAIRLIPFLDFGVVYSNSNVPIQQPDTLVSSGLSLELNYKFLRARLDYGIPLVEVPSTSQQSLSFSVGTQIRF